LAPRAGAVGYVVIELKNGEFQPECAGKLNLYVVSSAVFLPRLP
jgi:hypothetical protein